MPQSKTLKRLAAADLALADLVMGSGASRYYLYESAHGGSISFAGYEVIKLPAMANISGTGIEILLSASVLIAAPLIYAIEYKRLDKIYMPAYKKAARLYRKAAELLRQ
jgi:hypothetical protein